MMVASYPAPAMMENPNSSPSHDSISPMSKSIMRPSRVIFASAWGSLGESRFIARRFAVPAGKGKTGIPVSASW